MKLLSVSSLGSLLIYAVTAIDLDIDSSDSVKEAVAILSKGLRQYYTGDRDGGIPGLLSPPYHWWEAGAMFNTFINYWYYTGDDQYNAVVIRALEHQIGESDAFMPLNQSGSLGNDDQGFWGMTAMSAAESKLPELGDGKPSWLSLAQAVFNTQRSRWDQAICGGGLRWQINFFSIGYSYKNTISNGCLFNIAARLYKYLGDRMYLDWAEQVWQWELAVGLITDDYHFLDGAHGKENCTTFDHKKWTYNAGVHMAGAAAMWNASDIWRTRLEGIIGGLSIFFRDNVMIEISCENQGRCNIDQRSFKAYLSRWMAYTAMVAPWTRDSIDPRLQASAIAAAAQCTDEAGQSSCNLYWAAGNGHGSSFGVGEQMAALEVIQSLLYPVVAGPMTRNSGGTSLSSPNAGLTNTTEPPVLDDITLGDKIGAGVFTVVILASAVAGAAWMLSERDGLHFRRE